MSEQIRPVPAPVPSVAQPVPQPVPLAMQQPLPQQSAPKPMRVTPEVQSEAAPEKLCVISDWAMF
ncbi:hypothetical protein HCZ23_04095 [Celeribacter sp. HF31]|uniref:hypothetical protein n=1 Tax=Celeribacter sp. HF31 TaxID=2721558 RepID=UPI00143135D4|nr:hypothetical protein [Celeribacter sp. HF31]NIY78647.1 hypothetical protein [Celeribacter sp. HF31]